MGGHGDYYCFDTGIVVADTVIVVAVVLLLVGDYY